MSKPKGGSCIAFLLQEVEEDDEQEQKSLDAAVRSYEKAAGLLSHLL